MHRIRTAKIDDFSVAVDGCSFIFTAVVSKMTFHQPCLGMVWIDLQNAIDKYLGNFPTFF